MKKLPLLALIVSIVLVACEPAPTKETDDKKETITLTSNSFQAIPMPTVLITGDPFPTDSNTINTWIGQSGEVANCETDTNIIEHGWAIWAALNDTTNQYDNGQQLRRFETWYTPDDIKAAYALRKQNASANLSHVQRTRGSLSDPHQSFHLPSPASVGVVGFVKYDPSSAEHIYDSSLYYDSVLQGMMKTNEIGNIPNFPNSSVAIKPVFEPLIHIINFNGYEGGYLQVWPGEQGDPERPFGQNDWNDSVFVTDAIQQDIPELGIYAMNSFVNFKMDSAQAAYVGGKEGDYAVLCGMHVTTRENTRWTWQTFWWSKNQDTPFKPSSNLIASLRPTSDLDQGSNHYAMAIAYNTVVPAQPYNGGSGDSASSLYAYNPYLEAGFDTNTFSSGNADVQQYYPQSYQEVGGFLNQYGMQTNCMSCHGQARYISATASQGSKGHRYLTDQYFEMDAPYFKNTVKLDFTWSIQGNLIDDDEKDLVKSIAE